MPGHGWYLDGLVWRYDPARDLDEDYGLERDDPVRVANRPIAECGTHSGYIRHRRLHERSCVPCADARREYKRQWMARKRQRDREGAA